MTTVRQDQEFMKSMFGESKLQEAIDWVRRNMEPEDVFSEEQLATWARDKGFKDDEGDE